MSFECATNMTGYTINFYYGSNLLPNETTLPNKRGKRTTFTASSNLNSTDILCSASMGIMTLETTDLVYLYIQGTLTHKFLR